MTKLPWVQLALSVALPACSLVSEPGPSLETIWSVTDEIGAELSITSLGAADANHLYFHRGFVEPEGRALVAYSRDDGEEVWRQTIVGPCSPPLVHGDRVYCPGNFLYAFDAATGRQIWRTGDGSVAGTFQLVAGAADGARVYVGIAGAPDGDGRVFAVDAATGAAVWDRAFDGPGWRGNYMRSLALSPEGNLLVAFTAEFDPPRIFSAAVVVAVDPATGAERWRYVDGDATTNRDIGELTLWQNLVLYSDATGQEAVAFDRRTREVVWRAPFLPNSFSTLRPPYVADGVAYFTDTQGGVFAVDARTGQPVWTTEYPAGFLSHAVCGDVVYGDDQTGRLFDRQTGRYLGPLFDDDDALPGQVAVAGDVLYVSASTGVYAFDCSL